MNPTSPIRRRQARDQIALDRASLRSIDADGHLHVTSSLISAVQINPYYGREVPDAEALGLDPDRKYMFLRDPAALEAGVPSLQGKPLLTRHRAQTASDFDSDVIAGSVNNPVWESPNVKGELHIWDDEAIRDIESGAKKSLSAGYRWVPVMEAGTYNGSPFDGRMTEIFFNHVALVESPRVEGAMVGDEQIKEPPAMAKTAKKARAYIATQHAFIGALKAKAKVKFAGDASLDDMHKLLDSLDDDEQDTLEGVDPVAEPQDKNADDAMPDFIKNAKAEDKKAFDAWMKGKDKKAKDADPDDDDDDKKKKAEDDNNGENENADLTLESRGGSDADPDDDDDDDKKKKADDKRAKDARRAKDKRGKDAFPDKDDDDDKKKAEDKGVKGMDSAAFDRAVRFAVDSRLRNADEIAQAKEEVFPVVGKLRKDLAFDSAGTVYFEAMKMRGMPNVQSLKGLPTEAMRTVWQSTLPGASGPAARMAADSYTDSADDMSKLFPDAVLPRHVP